MTGIDYPPTRDYTLGAALEDVETEREAAADHVDELEERVDDPDRDDPPPQELRDARSERASLGAYADGLHWAVHGDGREDGFEGWGSDAEFALEATTSGHRARATSTIRNEVMGDVGAEAVRNCILAASIEAAPFIEPDDELVDRYQLVSSLPPGFRDWIDRELEDLNDLTPGN